MSKEKFRKTATGVISDPIMSMQQWDKLGGAHFGHKTASFKKIAANTSKYLLTHVTIMSSVMTESAPYDYLIKPECSYLVNNNDDGWENTVLKMSYRSFVGAFNFLEHYQNSKAAKGHIVDAVLRKIHITSDTWVYFVDLLVATDLAHEDLVSKIRNDEIRYLSMGCVTDLVVCSYCGHHVTDSNDFCTHLRYNKGQFLPDEDGVPRRVAELCFPPDTRVVMGGGERKAIQHLKVGDCVISHTGERQKISQIYTRKFSGKLTSLKVLGLPQDLVSTPNHPYWVLSPRTTCACGCNQPLGERTKRTFERREYAKSFLPGHNLRAKISGLGLPDFEFKEAQDLQVGDLLAMPIPMDVITPEDVTPARAELLGWFLAEGSYCKSKEQKRCGITLTLNATDELAVAEHLVELLAQEFPGKNPPRIHLYDRSEGGQKLVVVHRSTELAEWCYTYAGEYAETKKLHEDAIFWPLDLQEALLRAYVKGDGTVDSMARHSVASISETLVSQMQLIAARCNLWTRRQVIFDGRACKLAEASEHLRDSNNFKPLHTLHFSPSDSTSTFFDMKDDLSKRGIGAKWRQHENYMLYRITSTTTVDYDGPVHNIEVEKDHSYLVEGLAVHNCGHHTLPNGGVKFIEASWVAVPAFPGAAKRGVVADLWEGPKTPYTSDAASVSKAASLIEKPSASATLAYLRRLK